MNSVPTRSSENYHRAGLTAEMRTSKIVLLIEILLSTRGADKTNKRYDFNDFVNRMDSGSLKKRSTVCMKIIYIENTHDQTTSFK